RTLFLLALLPVEPARTAGPLPPGQPPPGRTRTGHLSPDGKFSASAAEDGRVLLAEVGGAKVPRPLAGHTAVVHALALSPDGRYLASAGADRTVRLWSVVT